jgi:hypothetical protein
MSDRRELAFERIEQVMPEVERLLVGHATTGSWTLGQILNHLSTAIRLSLDPGVGPRELEYTPELVRGFEIRRRRFFKVGQFPRHVEVPLPIMTPAMGLDDRTEANSLAEALMLLIASEGPFGTHPWLGPMSKQQWLDFHRMHCEHHLSFARTGPPGR